MPLNEDPTKYLNSVTYCRAHLLTRQEFNSSQSSQLFINCCFALSLSAMFWALTEAPKNQFLYLLWIPLTVYLIFTVWRQYSIYLIPLQFYRETPETDFEELITFIITFMLAAFSFVCLYSPHWSLICLLLILLLNLVKVSQMKRVLHSAPKLTRADYAINALKVFNIRLWVYIAILFLLILVVLIFQSKMTELFFGLIGGGTPLIAHIIARAIYSDFFSSDKLAQQELEACKYIASVSSAWSD